jgi:hypothetical protein
MFERCIFSKKRKKQLKLRRMILEKQKEAIVLEEGRTNSSTKMSLDLDSAQILMDMLSKNLYSDSIGSTIRECASNALDSHRKAGTDKPIIVAFNVNEQNNYEFSVEDFGTGLDDNDVKNIISKYGKSTKRQDANQLGMMGLGFKAPLAYVSSFYFVCRKNGMERKYMMFEGEDGNTIDLLYEKPTKEENGVKVIVPVTYGDRLTFMKKIREQLCYFESVYFNVPAISGVYGGLEIKNDFVIHRAEHFQFSEMNQDDKMHICLDNVYYPMDFAKLGISVIDCPIALRFSLSDGLFPTPNREALRYTKEGIEAILKKLELVADYFVTKYNESVNMENCTIFSVIEYYVKSSRYVPLPNNTNYDVTRIQNFSKIPYVCPQIDGIKHLDLKYIIQNRKDFLLNYNLKFKLNSGIMRDMSKQSYDYDFRPDKLKKPGLFVYTYKERLSGIKKDYLRTIHTYHDKVCLVKKADERFLGNPRNYDLDDYFHLLELKHYPKNKWREIIAEWKYIEKLISADFINLDELDIPDEYLQSRKRSKIVDPVTGVETIRRVKLKGEIVGKQAENLARYNGGRYCKFVPETYKLEEFEKFKGLSVYSSHDNYLKLDDLYGIKTKQKMRVITFSDREIKTLEKFEIHNLISFEKFMEGKNSQFKRLVTSFIIHQFIASYKNTFNLDKQLLNVSKELSEQLTMMKDYVKDNYVHERNTVYQSMVDVAIEHNLFDMNIYPEYLKLKDVLEALPFIEPLSNEVNYINDSNKAMKNVYADLFKYYGHRVNDEYYKHRQVLTDEVIEEITE